jgi:hypothetical protein
MAITYYTSVSLVLAGDGTSKVFDVDLRTVNMSTQLQTGLKGGPVAVLAPTMAVRDPVTGGATNGPNVTASLKGHIVTFTCDVAPVALVFTAPSGFNFYILNFSLLLATA